MKNVTKKELKEIEEFAQRLAVLYDFFDWKWVTVGGVPSVKDIVDRIIDLIKTVREDDSIDVTSCGGITVERHECGLDIYFSRESHLWLNEK